MKFAKFHTKKSKMVASRPFYLFLKRNLRYLSIIMTETYYQLLKNAERIYIDVLYNVSMSVY